MPLWLIYHPSTTFETASAKVALAESVTKLYARFIPAFYVNVLFIPIGPNSFFVSGVARPSPASNSAEPGPDPTVPFIRVHISNIARTLPSPEAKARFLEAVDKVLKSHIEDMGYDWEYHIEETDRDLWKIQGLVPPPPGSNEEKIWAEQNKATKWEKL